MSRLPHVSSSTVTDGIPGAQPLADGVTPRFVVLPWGEAFDWSALAATEQTTGVEPSIRLFLDQQLESGDLVVDLAAGAGFVALAAATSPAQPHVICLAENAEQAQALRGMADAADVFLEVIARSELSADGFVRVVEDRLLPNQRLFVHATPDATTEWLEAFATVSDAGRILAWCQGGESGSASLALAHASLVAHGYTPHELAELDGEPQLFAASEAIGECIALHRSVLAPAVEPERAPTTVETVAPAAPPTAVQDTPVPIGMHFIAPFCRTGYGIAGAHLLRALMLRGAPVSFFPLGAVDTSILPFAGITEALARQDNYDATAPSVRLSQQFDLALHVGSGPRVGFPIFELTKFSARERHHLGSQDRLLVCSEWARGVLLENGVWKTPIDIVPLGVDRDVFHERLETGRVREKTVFLQVGKLEPRKGQLELLRAFEAAFTPKDDVQLVLACHNPFLDAESAARALAPFRKSPMAKCITLHKAPLATQSDVAKLMASADCGVFASRAEGWNLEALEMLSVGRQVIATNYSAHTEYLTEHNARLVEVGPLEAAPGPVNGAAWAGWGASQHEQLVEHLRAVKRERESAPLPRNDAGIATAKAYSWDNAAGALLRAINRS